MPEASSNYATLRDFAQETSSEKRRALLRQVTDSFAALSGAPTLADCGALDELVSALTADLSTEMRSELAGKIALTSLPFARTARKLALDEIDVAQPVLAHSRQLTETDLLDVIAQKGQAHMFAMTKRHDITEKVSGALVEKGNDHVVVSLLENEKAKIGTATYEAVAVRARESTALHAPFVRRQNVPLDLLSDLYSRVEGKLRREILLRYESVPKEELEAAFERSRKRLSKAYGGFPPDYAASRQRVEQMFRRGMLMPASLVSLLREGANSRTAFIVAFARLLDVNYDLVANMLTNADLDTLAILCRAGGFERALYVTLAAMIAGGGGRMGNVEKFGALYESVPSSAAERAIRFWKIRQSA